jgi:uncharacterized protein YggU (UPF0235/DUF167 family)
VRILLKVRPGAKKDLIERMGPKGFKIQVRAKAENGRATHAALRLLGEFLGISASRINLISGAASRTKWVEISG